MVAIITFMTCLNWTPRLFVIKMFCPGLLSASVVLDFLFGGLTTCALKGPWHMPGLQVHPRSGVYGWEATYPLMCLTLMFLCLSL